MVVAAMGHFGGGGFVAEEEGTRAAAPAFGLGVVGVSGAVLGEDGPEAVDLVVLGEEVLTAERSWRQVPDAQGTTKRARVRAR